MTKQKTVTEDFNLTQLTIDDEPIQFTAATITKETTMLDAGGLGGSNWMEGTWSWHGHIRSDEFAHIAVQGESHRFEAESNEGKHLAGDFIVKRVNDYSVWITNGSEELTIT